MLEPLERGQDTLQAIERTRTLTDQAYDKLRLLLLAGTVQPGEKISIRKLAERLQISFTPAREALLRLAVERAVTVSTSRTVTVAQVSSKEMREIYELREMLEGLALTHGLPNLDSTAIRALESAQTHMAMALDDKNYEKALWHNYHFHFGLYNASGRSEVIRMIESLWLKLGPSLHLLYPTYQETRRGISHHQDALNAIGERDFVRAREAILDDIRDSRRELLSALAAREARLDLGSEER